MSVHASDLIHREAKREKGKRKSVGGRKRKKSEIELPPPLIEDGGIDDDDEEVNNTNTTEEQEVTELHALMQSNRQQLMNACELSALVLMTDDDVRGRRKKFLEEIKTYLVNQVEGGRERFIENYGRADYDLLMSIGRPELYSNLDGNRLDDSRVHTEELALLFYVLNIEQPIRNYFVPLTNDRPPKVRPDAFGEFVTGRLPELVKKMLRGRGPMANLSNFVTACVSQWFQIRGFNP